MRNLNWGFSAAAIFVATFLVVGCNEKREPVRFQMEDATEASSAKQSSPVVVVTDNAEVETISQKATKAVANTFDTARQKVAVESKLSDKPKGLFPIYTDDSSPDNHFAPSGWMGDYADISFDSAYMKNPQSGSTCIKIVYNNNATQGARWAGIYWQNPANNWGNRPGGYDVSGSTKLTFWARGEVGGERIEEFKMGGITGEFADTDVAGIGPVILTAEWKQYTIDLSGKDLSSIIGGFCWSANLDGNPAGATFYLDTIRFE